MRKSGNKVGVLFINDGSLINPIISSQGLPHLSFLAQKEFQIFVLSVESPKKGFDKEEYDRILSQYKNTLRFIKIRILPSSFLRSSTQLFFLGPFITIYLILKYRINFIHARSYIPAFIGLFVKWALGTKFIFDMRGLFVDEYVSKGAAKENSFSVRCMRFLEKKCLLRADEVVVVSEQFKRYVENLPYVKVQNKKIRITTISNSSDLTRFQLKSNTLMGEIRSKYNLDNRPVLLYSGSLASWQMPDMIVNFFKIFQEVSPNSFLLFVTHDNPSEVQTQLQSYSIPEANYYITKAKFDEVPDYLSLANIGILMRKNDLLNQVSCPTKFAEYLASGVPVLLTTGIGDTEQIVTEHRVGVIIRSSSEDGFRVAGKELAHFLSEDKKLLGMRCKGTAKKYFSLSNAVEKYYAVYSQLHSSI